MKKDLIKSAKASFEDYFCEYYSINKNEETSSYVFSFTQPKSRLDVCRQSDRD